MKKIDVESKKKKKWVQTVKECDLGGCFFSYLDVLAITTKIFLPTNAMYIGKTGNRLPYFQIRILFFLIFSEFMGIEAIIGYNIIQRFGIKGVKIN